MSDTTVDVAARGGGAGPFDGVPGVGDVVDQKYAIEEILGAGGMGVVVAARHLNLGERVAIKFLLPKVAKDRETVERFMREARASARIKNEHVVRVMDAGRLDSGAPYILMEYLEGTDLANLVRSKGPLPVHDAVDYVLQACEAIAEAHALGIVHRDLKPSNLFLTWRSDATPCIKVLDFGISKALGESEGTDPNLTDTQAVFGSPAYMSPEQIRSAKRVDHRTDVWALGVILYELLTDSLPFTGEHSAALLAAIAADAPPLMREKRPEISEGLDFVVSRCLEKDPSRRVQSIPELARALAPHAKPGSQSSIDRIQRLAAAKGPQRLSQPDEAKPVRAGSETAQSWGGPRSTRGKMKRTTMAAGLLAVLGAAALSGVVIVSFRHQAVPSASGPSSSGVREDSRPAPSALESAVVVTKDPALSSDSQEAQKGEKAAPQAIVNGPPVQAPRPPSNDAQKRAPLPPVRVTPNANARPNVQPTGSSGSAAPAPSPTASGMKYDQDRK